MLRGQRSSARFQRREHALAFILRYSALTQWSAILTYASGARQMTSYGSLLLINISSYTFQVLGHITLILAKGSSALRSGRSVHLLMLLLHAIASSNSSNTISTGWSLSRSCYRLSGSRGFGGGKRRRATGSRSRRSARGTCATSRLRSLPYRRTKSTDEWHAFGDFLSCRRLSAAAARSPLSRRCPS